MRRLESLRCETWRSTLGREPWWDPLRWVSWGRNGPSNSGSVHVGHVSCPITPTPSRPESHENGQTHHDYEMMSMEGSCGVK